MHDIAKEQPRATARWLASARKALQTEARGMAALIEALDGALGEALVVAIDMIRNSTGRVILSGVGKSGHIARKIAATLASTGTSAIFVHATEASHGDLGMISPDDVIIMVSNSGETAELKDILAYSRRFKTPLVAITGNGASTLARAADVALIMPAVREACPNGLAPTTSTTLQLALGDALAVALLEDSGFSPSDFRRIHPGGRLGAALTHVGDVMHAGDELPLVGTDVAMADGLVVMTEKSFGCLGVIDQGGNLVGIITDGDLRRHMSADLLRRRTGDVMTANPKTVDPATMASAALEILNSAKITALFVVEDNKPVGIVHIHDLLRLGVR